MKLIINEVEYNVDLTGHKTTQDEQLEVFWGEMDEFSEAYEKVFGKVYPSCDKNKLMENIAQECIDSIKSLAKWFKNMDKYNVTKRSSSIHYIISRINFNIEAFKSFKEHEIGIFLFDYLACFLDVFCKENNLNLTEQFKINNDKTNGRGTKKKVYLSDDEIIDLIEATNRLLSCGFPESSQKLQNIIDKIEG